MGCYIYDDGHSVLVMIPAFTEGGRERENMSTMARSCAGAGSAIVTVITMQCVYLLGNGNE